MAASRFTLEDILNAVSIPLDVDGVTFRLVSMNTRQLLEWQRLDDLALNPDKKGKGKKDEEPKTVADYYERIAAVRHDFVARHLRDCVVAGDASKVTAEWLQATFPLTIMRDLIVFLTEGTRPDWASGGAEGN